MAEYTLRLHPMVIRGHNILVSDTPCNPALLRSVIYTLLFHQHSLLQAGGINPLTIGAIRREVRDTLQCITGAKDLLTPAGSDPQEMWMKLVFTHIVGRHVSRYPLPENWEAETPRLHEIATVAQLRRHLNWKYVKRMVHRLCLLPHHPRTPLTGDGAYPAYAGNYHTPAPLGIVGPRTRSPAGADEPGVKALGETQVVEEDPQRQEEQPGLTLTPVLQESNRGEGSIPSGFSQAYPAPPSQNTPQHSREEDAHPGQEGAIPQRVGVPGSEGSATLGTEYRSDTKNAIMSGRTQGSHSRRKRKKTKWSYRQIYPEGSAHLGKWTDDCGWLNFLAKKQINPDRPSHLGRAYSSDTMGDAVDHPSDFPESIQRRLSPEAMSQVPGWSLCTGTAM
jgi:hypothetical protein